MGIIKYKSQEGQNIHDVILLFYGSLERLVDFIRLNPAVEIDIELPVGTEILIDDSLIVGDLNIKQKYKSREFITNNADEKFEINEENKIFQDGKDFIFQNGNLYRFN